jgi:hydrogenase maturation protease
MTRKTLVAGIGNVFFGDDGFGVEVAARLAGAPLPDGVRLVDTGIRARDLAYELLDGGYDTAILVDAVRRGEKPGTVSLIAPAAPSETGGRATTALDGHAMNPDSVFAFLAALGGVSTRIWIVGCEPACMEEGIGLSAPVTKAVDEALSLVRELLQRRDGLSPGRVETSSWSSDTCA